jgi:hypothetical protein
MHARPAEMRMARLDRRRDTRRVHRRLGPVTVAVVLLIATASVGLWSGYAAMTTRNWDGLEAVGRSFLQFALMFAVVWSTILTVGLVRREVWAWWATLTTLVVVAGCSVMATWETARRVLDDSTAPARHLAFPSALTFLSLAAVVLLVTPRSRSEFNKRSRLKRMVRHLGAHGGTGGHDASAKRS